MQMKKLFDRNDVKLWLFVAVLAMLYGFIFIFSEFYGSPFFGIKDFLVLVMQWCVVVFAAAGLLYALSLNKYLFAATFPLLTLVCTALTYFKYTLGVTLTPMIIDLTFVTDLRTSLEMFSWQLVVWLLLALVGSAGCVYVRFRYVRVHRWYVHLPLALLPIMLTNAWIPSFVAPVSARMPYSVYYNFSRYISEKRIVEEQRNTFDDDTPVCRADSLTVVYVLGESLRADHLSLNGYGRNTTPLLAGDTAVVSFGNIYTEPYYTHLCVPHILTRADSLSPERAFDEQSFITLLKKAGFHTAWIANQEQESSYLYFMNECDTLIYANVGESLYSFGKWLDGDMLPHYRAMLRRGDAKNFILLHTIGSHWWYNTHYPDSFETFVPVVKSRVVSACTQEEMINSYDNTVLYTDYIIDKLIAELRERNAVLVYLSDHGEALGEEGHYLHAGDYPPLHNPACFVYCSPRYTALHADKINTLKENRTKRFRTDFLFHTILDAADIESKYLDRSFSLFFR